jgi:hypothetical protein
MGALSMHKNLNRSLVISTFILTLAACGGGSPGGSNARRIPATARQIMIPSNYNPTTSSNLFFAPAISSATTLFIPNGDPEAVANINQSTRRPQQNDDASLFDELLLTESIIPTDLILSDPGSVTMAMTFAAIDAGSTKSAHSLKTTDDLVAYLATNTSRSGGFITADFAKTATFKFGSEIAHTHFYTATMDPDKAKGFPAFTIAAAGAIDGQADLWIAEALTDSTSPPEPAPANINGSVCAPAANDIPTAVNTIPADANGVNAFIVGTANGSLCSFNAQTSDWALLATAAAGSSTAINALQLVSSVAGQADAYFQTNTGIYLGTYNSTMGQVQEIAALTSLSGAPELAKIANKTMYVDDFGDVFVGGKDIFGRSVVYVLNSYDYTWETIRLTQIGNVPELEPVISITPSLQGTIIIGTGANGGNIKNIYELIVE